MDATRVQIPLAHPNTISVLSRHRHSHIAEHTRTIPMHLFVILALASVATCTALQSTLIRREPKTFQLIRNGKYPEYLKKLKSTQTAAGAGANVYRADFEIAQRVAIGTPPQEALAWLCTQASIMWVPHVDCRSQRCQNRRKFDPNQSSTFTPSDKKWQAIAYGGGSAAGILGSDQVKMGGTNEAEMSIPNITFGLATSLEIEIGEVEADGLLGLAFVPYEGTNSEPFITSAFRQGNLEQLFTVWVKPGNIGYGEVGGVITYGSTDTANCGPVFKNEPLSAQYSYQYEIDGISMGSYSRKAKFTVQQDLGTWFIAPPKIVRAMAQIAKAEYYEASGVYTIDCAAEFPDFKVTAGSTEFAIKAENLKFELEPGLCLFAFYPYQPQQGQADFNFGLPFNRQYCTIFDIGKKQIGFAESYPDGPRTTSTTSTQKPTTTTKRTTTSTLKPTTTTTSTQKTTTSTQKHTTGKATQETTPPAISTQQPVTSEHPKETTTSKKAGGIWIMQSFLISIAVFILHQCNSA